MNKSILHNIVNIPPSNTKGDISAQDFGEIIQRLFHNWEKAKIEFVVLRNYKGLPNFVGNDLDILVSSLTKEKAAEILVQTAQSFSYKLFNQIEFSCSSFYLVKQLDYPLHIDLFSNLSWRGLPFLSPEIVLTNKIYYGLFHIPHPIHEATLNLLYRLLYQGYVKDKDKASISAAYLGNPEKALALLSNPFGIKLADKIVKNVIVENWEQIKSYRKTLCKALRLRHTTRHPIQFFMTSWREAVRLTRRFLKPPGLFVVLIGPDGCGKTTLSSRLTENMGTMFSKENSLYIHWKPKILPTENQPRNVIQENPHGASTRNLMSSLAHFVFHWITFVLGSHLQIRPALFKNGLVIIDRYYHDFYIDKKRYRLKVPDQLISAGQRFIVNPNIVLYLDAPGEITQKRKREVSLKETVRQRKAYHNLLDSITNAYVIDASKSIDEVESQANKAILNYMVHRCAERFQMKNQAIWK